MTILGIDSTGDELMVGVLRDGKVRQEQTAGRPHSKNLLPLIEKLLGTNRPDAITVAIGPGSYTGTRVGVTTANVLGWAWSIPVYGIGASDANGIAALLEKGKKLREAGDQSKHAYPIYLTTPGA